MKTIILEHPRPLVEAHYNDVANAPLSASLNSGYAAAVCRAGGCDVEYLDYLCHPSDAETIANDISSRTPRLLLIHWVYNWDDGALVKETIGLLKQKAPGLFIVAFGLFPTFCYRELMKDVDGLDMILLGEFEETLAELLKIFPFPSSPPPLLDGTVSRAGLGGKRPLMDDLSRLPEPLDLGKTSLLNSVNIAAARGCYGNCAFCFIPPYYGASRWRGREITSVVSEIETRCSQRKANHVYFVDPNFFGPGETGQKRALLLGEELKARNLTFGLEARVNDIQADTIKTLSQCGLESVFLGIESASPEVLRRMRKGITPQQSARAVEILRDNGVFISVGFIMFDSQSRLEDLRINLEFLKRNHLLQHHDTTANVLYHNQIVLKGSPAYFKLKESGNLEVSALSSYQFGIRYREPLVAKVAEAMGRLTLVYFKNMDRVWRSAGETQNQQYEKAHCMSPVPLPEESINRLLLEAFESFLEAAEKKDCKAINPLLSNYLKSLTNLFL